MGLLTYNALLARGIDSHTSNKIINSGLTIAQLKTMDLTSLEGLGLSKEIATQIHSEPRPSIPANTVIKLLYDSRRTCCVCRDDNKSVIIHHITEWHETKDHSEENLVVLCLQHHDEAHTKKALSLNLSKDQIKEFKRKWLNDVANLDAKAILGLKNAQSRWDYVNIPRVFEMFLNSDIQFRMIKSFATLFKLNIVDKNGILTSTNEWKSSKKPSWHLCDFAEGIYLGHYLNEIVEKLISNLPIIDLTNNLNASFIKSIVKVGSVITGQLGFYFTDIDSFNHKEDLLEKQLRKGYYRGNSVRIEFQFDASHCTSSSGRFDALTNHKVAIPILIVRSIIIENGEILITGSCLAIGTWFNNHRIKIFTGSNQENDEETPYQELGKIGESEILNYDGDDSDLPF